MLNLLFSIIINIEIMLCSENMKIDLCTYFSNNNERTETHTIFKKSFQLSITIMANHHRLVLALTVSITVSKLANLLPAITHSFQINAQNTVETVRTLTLVSRYISKKKNLHKGPSSISKDRTPTVLLNFTKMIFFLKLTFLEQGIF